ncbi:DUF4007 family protein [Erythrobacter litoralis]|uniref:DUF4007 family protein n=1 Tax=Erythrobacter litoralis TaxID=39960 RepID=UPI002434FC14|nr:DUF4007 family protein [Erythrobacter litoralis]MDG6079019.1 DUF4007 family protein [Erythrobacter litoralis]
MRSLLDRHESKLQVAGHETFPCRYGWLKKSYDAVRSEIMTEPDGRQHAFSPNTAIADFGVGKNMVASMRHWALACGVLQPVGERLGRLELLEPTALGELIFGSSDPYLELPSSVWILHWRLAALPGRATTWYYAFNEFNDPVFTKDTLAERLWTRLDELRETGKLTNNRIAKATVARDAECLVRTYVTRGQRRKGIEDGLESPFTELGLLTPMAGGALQFRRGPKPTLSDKVFGFALLEFWAGQFGSRGALSVETIAHEPGSPGRVFLLDEDSLVERLERIEDFTGGMLSWDEGGGLRQVTRRLAFDKVDPLRLLVSLYAPLEKAA